MRPMDFAFMVLEGLPVEAEYTPIEAKTDKLQQILSSIMPQYPATITYSELRQKLMLHLEERKRFRKEYKESCREWIYYQKSGGLLLPAKD